MIDERGKRQAARSSRGGALPRPNPKAVQYNVLLATGDWRLGTDREW
jgi:hypothetical protein